MVATTNNSTNKTAFVVSVLQEHPKANPVFVNSAWKKAGRDGSISGTLVHKIRAELGLAGNLRARSKSTPADKKSKPGKSVLAAKDSARPATSLTKPAAQSNGTHTQISAPHTIRSADRDHVLEKVEEEIDRLIFSLMGVGGLDNIEDALRHVRRLVVRSLEK